jgi:hypothetical protein
LDIVQIGHALIQRPELGFGRKTVDRDLPTLFLGRQDNRGKAADFDIGRNRIGIWIAGRGADIKCVRPVGDEFLRMGKGRFRFEKPPAVGEGILRDVENAEKERVRHRLRP